VFVVLPLSRNRSRLWENETIDHRARSPDRSRRRRTHVCSAFLAVSHGLTDEQARSTPTVSTLCIGGLIKHVTTMEYAWTLQVAAPTSHGDMTDIVDQR
jgi:hypothetical protein